MTGLSADIVLEWDVLNGEILGAQIRCPDCLPFRRCRPGTGCDGQGTLHRPYRLPGSDRVFDFHRDAEILVQLLDRPTPVPLDEVPAPRPAPPARPNPARLGETGAWFTCPACGGHTEHWGTERRRWGWIPWRRLIHVDCPTPPTGGPFGRRQHSPTEPAGDTP